MINNVVLVGRLTKDAELRYTPSNVVVATFTLAVNRNRKNENGEREAVYVTEVFTNQFHMLESRNNQQGQSNNTQNGSTGGNFYPGGSPSSEFGGGSSSGGYQSPFGNSNPMDISDDDLPF